MGGETPETQPGTEGSCVGTQHRLFHCPAGRLDSPVLRLPDPQDSLYCWREKRSLVAVVPTHYSVWVHFELIVANNGHPTGLGREEGNQAYVSAVCKAA